MQCLIILYGQLIVYFMIFRIILKFNIAGRKLILKHTMLIHFLCKRTTEGALSWLTNQGIYAQVSSLYSALLTSLTRTCLELGSALLMTEFEGSSEPAHSRGLPTQPSDLSSNVIWSGMYFHIPLTPQLRQGLILLL